MNPLPLGGLRSSLQYSAELEMPSGVNEDAEGAGIDSPYGLAECEPAGETPTLQALCCVTDAIFEAWHDLSQPLIRMKRVRGARGFAVEIKAMNDEMRKLASLISNLVVLVRQLYDEAAARESIRNGE
jgi:hypothetical protein